MGSLPKRGSLEGNTKYCYGENFSTIPCSRPIILWIKVTLFNWNMYLEVPDLFLRTTPRTVSVLYLVSNKCYWTGPNNFEVVRIQFPLKSTQKSVSVLMVWPPTKMHEEVELFKKKQQFIRAFFTELIGIKIRLNNISVRSFLKQCRE